LCEPRCGGHTLSCRRTMPLVSIPRHLFWIDLWSLFSVSLTKLSLITLSPYTQHKRRWVSAALCPSAWRKLITARTSQLAGVAIIVSMFHQ
jgi:hypothetical protein